MLTREKTTEKTNGASFEKTIVRKGLFRGRGAQMMVFLNGLILTLTAFAALNIFIQQTIDENIFFAKQEVTEFFEARLLNIEKSFDIGFSNLSHAISSDNQNNIKVLFKGISYSQNYDAIYWLEQVGDGRFVQHELRESEILENATELHKLLIEKLNKDTDKVQIISNEIHPFIIAKPIKINANRTDIFYALASINKNVSPLFFEKKKNIRGVSLSPENNTNELFFYMDKNNYKTSDFNNSRTEKSLPLFDSEISLFVHSDKSEREEFLIQVPYLVLAFGLIFTLIGTMYVRSNHRQSIRLASINAELAQKNLELNREVSEREKLNAALARAEKENRAVMDSVSDVIFETTTGGQILFLNGTWQKITGFSPERSLGKNLFDLLYVQDQTEQKENFAQLVKGTKQGYRAYTRLRSADGNFRAVELAVSMLRQDENKESRVVGTITDVEERRRTERALSEAEKKYRAIVENAASGIYQVTAEGHYLGANPATARILGYDAPENVLREIKNANAEIYCDGRERERSLRDAVRAGSITAECQLRRKDGKLIWVQENLRAVKDDNDQLIYFEGSMDDITQRKETEIALRAAKVDSDLANRAKSEFLANMSHELRTPLNAIIGFSDIIRTQAFGDVGRPEYLDYARDIHDGGKRLLQIINDILDVSRIEAGERQLNESIVDLNKILGTCLEMLAPKVEANNMLISNLVDENTPKLIGEIHAIKQMMTNLLSNAVKFTPSGGRITIHADVDDFGQMHISVTDTGIGLTDKEMEKALSPFGQVNASFDKNESGTGLGLTLVQSLMSLHGGSFEMFSQKGVGTTATLIFPPKRVSIVATKMPERV